MPVTNASRGKGYPFPRLLGRPQTPNANFLKFTNRLQRGFSFFWNVVFIVLYIKITIESKIIFDKIFKQKIPYLI